MAETIHYLRIWLKVFIPHDIETVQTVPGSGPHAGKTMLSSPPHFLTDQRGFSPSLDAHSRMHSEIEIDTDNARLMSQFHSCYPTIQVDPGTGEEKCRQSANTKDMVFSDFRVTDGGLTIAVDLRGSAQNPCMETNPSPNVNYEGTLAIQLQEDRRKALLLFNGKIETYPAFEMYAIVNNGPAQVIFQEPIQPGIMNLVGLPARAVNYRVELIAGTAAS